MKKGRCMLAYLLLILIMTQVQSNSSSIESAPKQAIQAHMGVTEYEPHNPIKINGDNEFALHGFDGSGTPDDPYLIHGFNITKDTSGDLISIYDSTVFFKISNCYLNGMNSSYHGIYLQNVANGIINNNIVTNSSYGIDIAFSNRNSLFNNMVFNTGIGIDLWESHHNTVLGNTINGCLFDGIRVSSTGNDFIYNNTISDCAYFGIELTYTQYSTISYNTISTCAKDGIEITSSNHSTLTGNMISNCDYHGISVYHHSRYNTLSYNMISNCGEDGIYVYNDNTHNSIFSNTISDCEDGIYLGYSNYCTLYNNRISNSYTGYNIWSCKDLTISSNTIFNCSDQGIDLRISNQSVLTGNTISNCSWNGFRMGYYCSNNTLSHNTIYNNSKYAFEFSSTCNDNMVNLNNLIDNNKGGSSQALDDGATNNMSYNFWNEWTSPDNEPDGIVDLPYSITGSATNSDPSPLTTPIPPQVIVVTPLEQEYATNTITVSLSGNALQYWYYIEGEDNDNQTWTLREERTLEEDTYTLHAYGQIFGSISHVTATFTVDTTPPVLEILSPIDSLYKTSSILVNLSGDAEVEYYWYNVKGVHSENQTWTDPVSRSLADGTYILYAYANDSAGNIAIVSVTFKIDTVAPFITLETPVNDTIQKSGTMVKINVSDDSLDKVLYNWDGSTNKTWNGNYETSLPTNNTQHVLYVYANDSTGIWASKVYVFTTDDIKPSVEITSPIGITYDQDNVTLTYTISDGTITVYINGQMATTHHPSGTILQSLSGGTYNITITAVDQAGNIGTDTVIFTIATTEETTTLPSITPFPSIFTVLITFVLLVVQQRRRKV